MSMNADIDEQALRSLLPALRRFALSLAREPSAADDLVQACLERALVSWGSRNPSASLKSWLFTILYRHFLDSHRRAAKLSRLLRSLSTEEEQSPSPEQSFLASSSLAAFARLSDEHRAVLFIITVEGLSYEEAARTLGIPLGTVMSRLSRARQAYREIIEDAPVRRLRRVK
jgi:RNA polymerase sigma-70 factor (ECF subfamily)